MAEDDKFHYNRDENHFKSINFTKTYTVFLKFEGKKKRWRVFNYNVKKLIN